MARIVFAKISVANFKVPNKQSLFHTQPEKGGKEFRAMREVARDKREGEKCLKPTRPLL